MIKKKTIIISKQDIVLALMVNAYDIRKASPKANFGLFDIVDSELVDIIGQRLNNMRYTPNYPVNFIYTEYKPFTNSIANHLVAKLPGGETVPVNNVPKNDTINLCRYTLPEGTTLDSPTSESRYPDYIISIFKRSLQPEVIRAIKHDILYIAKELEKHKFISVCEEKIKRYASVMDLDVLKEYLSEYEKKYLEYYSEKKMENAKNNQEKSNTSSAFSAK